MLEELPREHLKLVVEYTKRPSHLKSICRVSRTLNPVATPVLYSDVKLDIDKCGSRKIVAFVKSNSRSRAFVRALAFQYVDSDTTSPSLALNLIKATLRMLPSNSLRYFEMPSELQADDDLFHTVATTQQRLEKLVGEVTFPALLRIMSSPFKEPE